VIDPPANRLLWRAWKRLALALYAALEALYGRGEGPPAGPGEGGDDTA
jgi:hypothetical protein